MTAATFSTEGDVGILTLNKSTTQPLGRGLLDTWKTSVDQACRSGIRALVVWAGESARLGQTEAVIATGLASLGNEPLTNYTDNHRKAVAAFSNKRKPVFGAS